MKRAIKNIGMLVSAKGALPLCGERQGAVKIQKNAYILMEDGVITAVGENDCPYADEYIDANGALVTPGLVDCHTHLVFGGWRDTELAYKLAGMQYLDILKNGGGILDTLKHTREATEDELFEKADTALFEMLSCGTTTCEAKSGYGLSLEHELKQLNVVNRLKKAQPVDIVSTFMAAHAVPPEFSGNSAGYIREIIDVMLPAVAKSGLASYCDAFCETGVFDADECRLVLEAAKKLGLGIKLHADEIDPIGGSLLAGELHAVSAEHLIAIDKRGIAALASGGTIAALLPCTSFYLGKSFAPAREMLNAGIPIAVATDFNPGSSPNLNLQLAMNLACYKYRLTPAEVLCAVTLNAAAAIGMAEKIGTVEPGKNADIVIWDADNLNMIFYRYGSNRVKTVIKRGETVFTK